ncbi:Protein of unknown function [Gryllus bimaculatus]|nr:Protein of unknown function [Gryllus bimaculatus]
MPSVKQERADDSCVPGAARSLGSMQKVPSLSDLSDPESSLDVVLYLLPIRLVSRDVAFCTNVRTSDSYRRRVHLEITARQLSSEAVEFRSSNWENVSPVRHVIREARDRRLR